jgi:hypothetical protein
MARSTRQRGFSMIVVFLLLTVMVALAATVLLVTQGDLRSTGQDRVAVESFYGAEAAVAYGKEFLYGRANGVGAGAWSALLSSGVPELCAPGGGSAPGTAPVGAPQSYDAGRSITFQFCLHDNAMDPNYFGNKPTGDTTDGDGIIAIEGYGFGPDGAKSHVSVEVKALPVTVSNVSAYFQSGSSERKSAVGDGTQVGSGAAVSF